MIKTSSLLLPVLLFSAAAFAEEEVVTFPSGQITLHGMLYKPSGKGPFPAVVYNHGSAAGMLSKEAFDALGPVFAEHGWVFPPYGSSRQDGHTFGYFGANIWAEDAFGFLKEHCANGSA